MTDPSIITAEQVLERRWVFDTEPNGDETKRWLKFWHPDLNADPRAKAVFQKLQEELHGWRNGRRPNTLVVNGHTFRYYAVRSFELGELYVGEKHVIWSSRRSDDDLSKRWIDAYRALKFPSDKDEELRRYVPRFAYNVTAQGDRTYVILHRSPGMVRLADVLAKIGPLEPKHVGWVLNRAYALATGLAYSGVTHLDFSVESFFIDPGTHDAALLGGWYYTGYGRFKPRAAPRRSLSYAKLDRNTAHLRQIKAMGRKLLGASSIGAVKLKKLPQPLEDWFTSDAGPDPVAEWGLWGQALAKAYGPAKFHKLTLTVDTVYPKEN